MGKGVLVRSSYWHGMDMGIAWDGKGKERGILLFVLTERELKGGGGRDGIGTGMEEEGRPERLL